MSEIKRVVFELALIAALGIGIGLTANALNPDGLALGRDYFRMDASAGGRHGGGSRSVPETAQSQTTGPAGTRPATSTAAADDDAAMKRTAEALKNWGLQPIEFEEVKALYEDLWYASGVYVFIDSRDDQHYTAGHIPGAHQLDYYFIDRYIQEVLAAGQAAVKIVVYCNGGDCEDSKLAADALRNEHGVDPMKLHVYVGGMNQWQAKGMPVEKGACGSGDITGGKK